MRQSPSTVYCFDPRPSMWCSHCQSDVPHTVAEAHGGRRCSRCGRFVASAYQEPDNSVRATWCAGSDEGLDLSCVAEAGPVSSASFTWDDWKLAAELRRARLLYNGTAPNHGTHWRVDPNDSLPELATLPLNTSSDSAARSGRTFRPIAPILAVAVGSLAFGYGGAVTVSLLELKASTQLGIPLMLAGLFGVVLGVLMQVAALRRESHLARDYLRLLDARLREYRQTALLAAPHASHDMRPLAELRGGGQKNARLGSLDLFGVEHL
jgi:hypothetical protein